MLIANLYRPIYCEWRDFAAHFFARSHNHTLIVSCSSLSKNGNYFLFTKIFDYAIIPKLKTFLKEKRPTYDDIVTTFTSVS